MLKQYSISPTVKKKDDPPQLLWGNTNQLKWKMLEEYKTTSVTSFALKSES